MNKQTIVLFRKPVNETQKGKETDYSYHTAIKCESCDHKVCEINIKAEKVLSNKGSK